MNIKNIVLATLSLSVLINCNTENNNQNNQEQPQEMTKTNENITPPICKKISKTFTNHGVERTDDYYWLNERENVDVIDYLNNENSYTKKKMAKTEELQSQLFTEMKARIKEDDSSVPYFKNGYFYKTKFEQGSEYPIFCRATKEDFSDLEVFLDCNELAKDQDYFDIGGLSISPNNEILAYCTDLVSRRIYTIQFKNLKTGKLYKESIINNEGSLAWANDNKTLFYGVQDPESLRSNQIYKHTLESEPDTDQLIFEEKDDTFGCFVYRSKSGKYITISSYSTLTDEYQFVSSDTPDAAFKVFQKREKGLEYTISHYKDKFFIKTNKDKATNFQLMVCPENATSQDNWTTLIANRSETLLDDFELFENHLVLSEITNGLTLIRILNHTTNEDYYLPFNDETYIAYPGRNPDFNTNKLRVSYTSLTTPSMVYDFDMDTKEETILKQAEVVGGYNSKEYESKRIWATARDGVKVPMSLVYKKGTKLDGTAPLLQYAYGSYGSSTLPSFSSSRLSLLNRGFIFAIAHIRGGEEMGRQWYEDGKMLKKKNTFNDFIDCSKHLITEKYTSAEHLYAMGGSAGGLLMGVIVNDAPELYNGVLAAVPFVDVMSTMLDESIPLTTGEYDEWGNPNEKKYFDYMLSYSPYDQVKKQAYPNMLVTTGLHDSQVQYWEPAKWVAKLREYKTDNNVLLLETNMTAGHGGASGRFEYLKEIALEYAFMIGLEEGLVK